MLMNAPKPKLYTRLAQSEAEIEAAQRLRFDVFYRERNRAAPEPRCDRDMDHFDAFSDHLLVFRQANEQGPGGDDALVGTYRLLRQEIAEQHGGFYSAQEFALSPLLARKKDLRFLELGRSCVLVEYRAMPVIGLLWQGIWDYVRQHSIDVMIGCASLEGTDVARHRPVLQFLGTHCKASEDWQVRALPGLGIPMVEDEAAGADLRKALRIMPPLVRGYLGLGCSVAEDAYVDRAFDTVDVFIILPVAQINPRYFAHFGAPAG